MLGSNSSLTEASTKRQRERASRVRSWNWKPALMSFRTFSRPSGNRCKSAMPRMPWQVSVMQPM